MSADSGTGNTEGAYPEVPPMPEGGVSDEEICSGSWRLLKANQ